MSQPLPETPHYPAVLANRFSLVFFLIVATTNITACSIYPENKAVLRYHFDKKTGANITSLAQPLVFYRERPWISANTSDYIYLGPIEINRTGQRNYLLWLGIWSTIDKPGQPSESVRDNFQTVFLVTDEEPMELEIETRTGKILGMTESVYSTPVDSAFDAFYAVTRDQIRRLAEAKSILIYPGADAPPGTAYMPRQQRNRSMVDFMSYLSGE